MTKRKIKKLFKKLRHLTESRAVCFWLTIDGLHIEGFDPKPRDLVLPYGQVTFWFSHDPDTERGGLKEVKPLLECIKDQCESVVYECEPSWEDWLDDLKKV